LRADLQRVEETGGYYAHIWHIIRNETGAKGLWLVEPPKQFDVSRERYQIVTDWAVEEGIDVHTLEETEYIAQKIVREIRHSPFPINQPGKQRAEEGQHLLRRLEALRAAGGSGHQLERAPTHFERQRLAGDAQFDQAALHLERKILQDAFHLVPVADIALEGHLFPDRFA